jgi:hypothetical protein
MATAASVPRTRAELEAAAAQLRQACGATDDRVLIAALLCDASTSELGSMYRSVQLAEAAANPQALLETLAEAPASALQQSGLLRLIAFRDASRGRATNTIQAMCEVARASAPAGWLDTAVEARRSEVASASAALQVAEAERAELGQQMKTLKARLSANKAKVADATAREESARAALRAAQQARVEASARAARKEEASAQAAADAAARADAERAAAEAKREAAERAAAEQAAARARAKAAEEAAAAAAEQAAAAAAASASTPAAHYCPSCRAPLFCERAADADGAYGQCDGGCDVSFRRGDMRWSCSGECDYDICPRCLGVEEGPRTEGSPKRKAPASSCAEHEHGQSRPRQELAAQ